MKLLFISNSFGVNLQTYAADIAKYNGVNVDIYTLYIGGCTLKRHAANINSDKKEYEVYYNGESLNKMVSLKEGLSLDKFDIISLQQSSHDTPIMDSYDPYFGELYKYVKSIQPQARIAFFKTWAYSKNNPIRYETIKDEDPNFPCTNNHDMKLAIDKAVDKIKEKYEIEFVINSGDLVSASEDAFGNIYEDDGFHLNKLGCYIVGTHLAKLLNFKRNLEKVYVPEEFEKKKCEHIVDFVNNFF